MNIYKDLTKMLKPVGKLLQNKSVRIPLIVLLVVYISSAIPQLTRQVNTFMNNLIIRLLVLAGVIYLVQKDLLLALLLLTLYIMTSNKVSEYMTDMKKEGEDKKEHDGKKKHDDSKKEEGKEKKEGEHDKKMKKENMAPMATDRMDSLGDDDEEAFTLFEGMAHSDEEEETEDFTSGCVPKASNSPIKCFSNEKNASPCSPCGEVGAFDKEMSTQGLSGVMGYPGSELSSF